MCKRILNIRDNDTYTPADIGRRLNDYFIKHNLKVTNKHYEKHLFLDLCKAEGLEPGKHKGYEFLPIAQKEIDRVKANQGKKTAQPKKKATQPKKASAITPIEEMAEQSAREMAKAEPVKAIPTKEPAEGKKANDFISRSALIEEVKTMLMPDGYKLHVIQRIEEAPAFSLAANVDEFKALREKLYTDIRYFTKTLQTPEERAAAINALAALYGFAKSFIKKKEG